jgi:hypothetical protein
VTAEANRLIGLPRSMSVGNSAAHTKVWER